MSQLYKKAVRFLETQRRRNAARKELYSLTTRELADLGITRGEIEFVVRQTYK